MEKFSNGDRKLVIKQSYATEENASVSFYITLHCLIFFAYRSVTIGMTPETPTGILQSIEEKNPTRSEECARMLSVWE